MNFEYSPQLVGDGTAMVDAGLIPDLPDDIALQCLLRVSPQSHAQLQRVSRRWRELVNSPEYYQERKREGLTVQFLCMLQVITPPNLQSPSPASQEKTTSSSSTPMYGISVLNVQQRTWERLPAIPDHPEGLPLFCRLVATKGKLVVLGGWDPTTWETLQTVYIFDFSSQIWSRGVPMPSARSFFACAASANYVFIAGGHDNTKTALTSALVYNLDDNTWNSLPSMSVERDESTSVTLDGKFYVLSGYPTDSQGQFVKSAEVYSPADNSWTLIEEMLPMELQSSGPGSLAVMSGKFYRFTGQNLCCYDPATGLWTVVNSLPEGEVDSPVCVAAVDGGLLVTGPSRKCCDQGYRTLVYKPIEKNGARRCNVEWERVERDAAFVGVAQTSCAVEI